MEISDEARGALRTDKQAAILRGSARGLEIVVDAPSGLDAIIGSITARLAEAPDFFKGSDVRIRVEDGPLPAGSLGPLEELAQRYSLRLVEIGAQQERKVKGTQDRDAIPQPAQPLAIGSGGFDDVPTAQGGAYRAEEFEDIPTQMLPSPPNPVLMATAMVLGPALGAAGFEAALASARSGLSWVPPKGAGSLASPPSGQPAQPLLPLADIAAPAIETVSTPVARPIATPPPAPATAATPAIDQLELALQSELEPEIEIEPETRIVVGPVRSGVILDHRGHLIVFGDVNPGAEVRAAGNIVVLGRLRGLAHAGIGSDNPGFIVALQLQPQQLRIGRMVARASDDAAAAIPEIAYVTNGSIVVERYNGRLPNGLAASLS